MTYGKVMALGIGGGAAIGAAVGIPYRYTGGEQANSLPPLDIAPSEAELTEAQRAYFGLAPEGSCEAGVLKVVLDDALRTAPTDYKDASAIEAKLLADCDKTGHGLDDRTIVIARRADIGRYTLSGAQKEYDRIIDENNDRTIYTTAEKIGSAIAGFETGVVIGGAAVAAGAYFSDARRRRLAELSRPLQDPT